jgi:hypothetical protein
MSQGSLFNLNRQNKLIDGFASPFIDASKMLNF